MLKTLQALRGVFAVMIFLHHCPWSRETHVFDFAGSMAVVFFFILSGFVLSAGYEEKILTGEFRYREFLVKRMRKIWPMHLLCLAVCVAIVVCQGHLEPSMWAKAMLNATMLHALIPYMPLYFSFNGVSWFLSTMVVAYAAYPFICRHIVRRNRCIFYVTAPLAVLMLVLNIVLPESYCNDVLYVNPVCRMVDILLGIALYQVYKKLRLKQWRQNAAMATLLEIAIVALMVGIVLASIAAGDRWQLAVIWWIPISIMIVYFALQEQTGKGVICRLLHSRVMQWLGALSFPFYMIHLIVIDNVYPLFNDVMSGWYDAVRMVILFAACVMVALVAANGQKLIAGIGKRNQH